MSFLNQDWRVILKYKFHIFGVLILAGISYFAFSYQISQPPSLKAMIVPNESQTPIPENTNYDYVCDNYLDIQEFEKPVPITWTAKLDGCLMSCYGASFTRVPSEIKYPRFAGYYHGDQAIPDKFLEDGLTLKIYGNWNGIDADHPRTVFENKCVPMVDIKKIEVIR
jgi:hypothetical protein